MGSGKISYTGVAGAVAGIVGVLGIFAGWWETSSEVFYGTADISGQLGLAMAIATFAFGGAYILMADEGVRRAMGSLMTLCAVVLTLACVWGFSREADVAAGASVDAGLYVSVLGGLAGIVAGLMAIRDKMMASESSSGTAVDEG